MSIAKTFPASTRKGSNLCVYRKMAESERVPGKGKIPASIDKLSRRILEKDRMCVTIKKWMNADDYGEKLESLGVSKNLPDEYRKRVESV